MKNSTYKPPLFLYNGHFETIFPALFRKVKGVDYKRERIVTDDEDFLDLDWSVTEGKGLVILTHGLEGDSKRPYIKGMVKAFNKMGWDALAWNFRGCSGDMNKTLRFYHSGATEDIEAVLKHVIKHHQYSNIVLIGFSLGGNLVLKYLGEKGSAVHDQVKKSVVFSVPLDLYASCMKLSKRTNIIYSRRFLNNLKNKVKNKALSMPELLKLNKEVKSIYEFDEYYTAPLHGFDNAHHYYKSCSSIHFIEKIKIPTLLINAQNDPLLSKECFPIINSNPYVNYEYPVYGGHCGFYASNKDGLYWSEKRAVEFVLHG